jgi:CRP-like cAMP-binding protein/Fe-S-cluster-containing hydrogenase component 2
MSKQVMPQADLAPRPGDESPASEALEQLALFQSLKKKPGFDKYPNSVILRRFRPGEVICRQGDAGASAYYILTAEDVLTLRRAQQADARQIAALEQRCQQLANVGSQDAARQRATAHLVLGDGQPRGKSFWQRILGGGSQRSQSPGSIAIDGPSSIDMATRRAPLYEGEVFGEMSCLTHSPRSATVVADSECYLLEFLRNIFDQINKDAGYQQRIEGLYRERILANHLKRLPLLADCSDDELTILRAKAELRRAEPGDIIFDQGDEPDCVYLIRSGLVQVVTDPCLSLRVDDVLDWGALAKRLVNREASGGREPPESPAPASTSPASDAPKPKPSAADILAAAAAAKAKKAAAPPTFETTPSAPPARPSAAEMLAAAKAKTAAVPVESPGAHLWIALDKQAQAAAQAIAADPAAATAAHKSQLIAALNSCMRNRDWLVAKPLAELLAHADVTAQTKRFPKGIAGIAKDWTDLEVRVAGRVVLQLLCGDALKKRPLHSAPPQVWSYLSRGDIFGEIGVITRQPRAATCIAYDHPPDPDRSSVPVDLVRISAEVFREFVERSPKVKARIDAIINARLAKDTTRASLPSYQTSSHVADLPDFQELGLIQGQKLLLIDLDRCTRCGDCVRACINTHDDGRSRLYLDGPRFDRYLVPSACRNCLNPACMIGCPVGSIQRGDDGQIEIRDWCIGCKLCADQCPYDSIQMHDLGLVPAGTNDWTVAPTTAGPFVPIGSTGYLADKRRFAPCTWNLALQLALGRDFESATLDKPIVLRREFEVSRQQLKGRHLLTFMTQGSAATVLLNGREFALALEASQRRGENRKLTGEMVLSGGSLRAGRNLLELHILPPISAGDCVFDLEITPAGAELQLPEGTVAEVKQVSQRAVVCDLCSSLWTGPACVTMCPHDAAFRVDARTALAGG